jgi:exodeoxyribonuclease V alpha subunit
MIDNQNNLDSLDTVRINSSTLENANSLTFPFASYNHANQYLAQLEAIDYFFATDVIKALLSYAEQSNKVSVFNRLQQNITMLWHVFAALSESLRLGNSCLSLDSIALKLWAHDDEHSGYTFHSRDLLKSILNDLEIDENQQQLVVFKANNLYMHRYYLFESDLKKYINEKLSTSSDYSTHQISECLNTLFPQNNNQESILDIDWQKLAVANAINKKFSIIAGGPGTGKTYTVTKLLAALVMLNSGDSTNKPLKMALVAPTGKAAQRLSESLVKAISGFNGVIDANVLSLIPTSTITIHRLLGVIPNSPNFKHDQNNPLDDDILLIDEVSMVDLPMMTRVFRALKPNASVILLGDADQLPSVAVGSVLADLAPRPHYGYSNENLIYLASCCDISPEELSKQPVFSSLSTQTSDHLSFLLKSRRFDGEGGIGRIAKYVIEGNVFNSWSLLNENQLEPILAEGSVISSVRNELSLVNHDLALWLTPLINEYYLGISQCEQLSEAFELLARFRILCVMRVGEYGVDAINLWVKSYLTNKTMGANANEAFFDEDSLYHGLPIMITQNNYRMNLFNGDIGLIWKDKNSNRLVACFEQTEDKKSKQYEASLDKSSEPNENNTKVFKQFLPSRLPSFESVYDMTIHKTQGSEFEHVALILPKQKSVLNRENNQDNKLLSRELLYTGITRAKQKLTIASDKSGWEQGVKTQVKRDSGLYL